MKKASVLIGLIFCVLTICKAQVSQVKVDKLQDKALVTLLCNIDTTISVSNNGLAVRFYRVSNASGSAHLKGSDEISHRFVIAVSEFGEHPEQYVYTIGNFYNPQILKIAEAGPDEFTAIIVDGAKKSRRQTVLQILLSGVTMQSNAIKD